MSKPSRPDESFHAATLAPVLVLPIACERCQTVGMSDFPRTQNQVIYQQIVKTPTNGLAVASLVLGIVAMVIGAGIPIPFLGLIFMFFAFVPAVLAIIFGHVAFRSSTKLGGTGRGSALTGLVLGYLTIAISAATTFAWIVLAASSVAAR